MNRELNSFFRNIIQDSFVKLYFPHDDMHRVVHFEEGARPHFNWKTIFANAGISHYKDKLVSLPSYLYNGNANTVKTTFLSWDGPWFLAATKQLYEWFSPSVRPSVCYTVLTMFPSSYHHKIFRSYNQWQKWRPCKRSRSKVKGQGHRGQHPT